VIGIVKKITGGHAVVLLDSPRTVGDSKSTFNFAQSHVPYARSFWPLRPERQSASAGSAKYFRPSTPLKMAFWGLLPFCEEGPPPQSSSSVLIVSPLLMPLRKKRAAFDNSAPLLSRCFFVYSHRKSVRTEQRHLVC
jgi:hypothetical protein